MTTLLPVDERLVDELSADFGAQVERSRLVDVVRAARADLEQRGAVPQHLALLVVRAADVVVTMGCGDECPHFPGRRYEDWDVPDPAGLSLEQVRDVRDDLQIRVSALLRDLHL